MSAVRKRNPMSDSFNERHVNTTATAIYRPAKGTISRRISESVTKRPTLPNNQNELQLSGSEILGSNASNGRINMKLLGLTALIALLLNPAAFAKDDSVLARVTVYWASGGSGSDRNTRHHRCATGTRLRAGHCAVDPRHIPYGSRVLLPTGESLAAVDTGSAVRSRKAARRAGRTVYEKSALVVDRFFETKGQALAWARSHPAFMPIKVVRPGMRAIARSAQSRSNAPGFPRAQAVVAANASMPAKSQSAVSAPLIASNDSANRASLNRMGR
jgi:3D (Asp-Asp-Asp) domain-containing protein